METKTPKHPWQNAPIDFIKAAIEHLNRKTTADDYIAFLIVDIGVEMVLKTYLILLLEQTKPITSLDDREEILKCNFHRVLKDVRKNADEKLDRTDFKHLNYFHSLRNKLYHEGNGLAINKQNLDEYVQVALKLLKYLLNVDLATDMHTPKQRQEFRKQQEEKVSQNEKQVHAALEELDLNIKLVIERIEPKLILPSFTGQFNSLVKSYQVDAHDPFETFFILTQDPQERLELTKELDLLIDFTIRDLKAETRNLVRSSFISVLNTCGTDLPTLEMLYYEIVKRVVRIESDNLWGTPVLASLYPDSHPSGNAETSEEEDWKEAIEEGDRLSMDIKKLAIAIKDWIEKSQSSA